MDHGTGNPHIGIRHLQPVLDLNPKARPSRLPHVLLLSQTPLSHAAVCHARCLLTWPLVKTPHWGQSGCPAHSVSNCTSSHSSSWLPSSCVLLCRLLHRRTPPHICSASSHKDLSDQCCWCNYLPMALAFMVKSTTRQIIIGSSIFQFTH